MAPKTKSARNSGFQVKLGDLIKLPVRPATVAPPPAAVTRDTSDLSTLTRDEIDRVLDNEIERGRSEQFGKVMTIGPTAAEAILARSPGNVRPESSTDIAKYARDIISGNWKVTSESIEFDRDGNMRNAHHRLRAVIQARIPIGIFVVFGTDPDSYKMIDGGRKRSVHRVLGMPAKHKAIVNAVLRLASGKHTHIAWTPSEIESAYGALAPAFEAVLRGTKTPKYAVGFWAVLVALHGAHPERVAQFTHEVYDGGDTIHSSSRTMREFLLESRGTGAGQQYDHRVAAYTMYAIRAFIEGRALTRFSPRDRDKDGNRVSGEHGVDAWFRQQIGAEG